METKTNLLIANINWNPAKPILPGLEKKRSSLKQFGSMPVLEEAMTS